MDKPSSVSLTLGEIATRLGGDLSGSGDRPIGGVRPIATAGPDQITFLDNEKYRSQLPSSRAGAVIIGRDVEVDASPPTIRVEQPYVAFAQVLEMFHPRSRERTGVHEGAHVDPTAVLGDDCRIFAGAYIGANTRIGARTDIYPGVFVGEGASVGSDCLLYPNVVVYDRCQLGDRVILHGGVVVGSDGFGYAQRKQSDPNEPVVHHKIPQVGIVIIEDDVEIGANTTIDRAALEETRIGKGTKIDNLVQIGHNCQIGRHAIIISQVGVSGSTRVGNYVTVAGQAGLVGHCTIGDGAQIAAQAGVTKDVPPGKVMLGSPAIEARTGLRAYSLIENLPEYKKKLAELERRIAELEGKSDK